MIALETPRPSGLSGAWVVRGVRTLPDGSQQAYLSCAWGRDESRARRCHAMMQAAGVGQGSVDRAGMWSPEELTFTPTEQDQTSTPSTHAS